MKGERDEEPERSRIPLRTRVYFGDGVLLCLSAVMFLLVVIFVIGIAAPVTPSWRKALGFLGVIGLLGSPNLLVLGVWEAIRYGRGWRKTITIALSLTATILAWGITVLYAMGSFGFSRS